MKRLEHEHELALLKCRLESEQAKSAAEKNSQTAMNDSVDHNSDGYKKYNLGVGMFDNEPNNLDAFISRFEVIAKAYNLPTNLWAVELAVSTRNFFGHL